MRKVRFNVVCTKDERKELRKIINEKKEDNETFIEFLLKLVGDYNNKL